VAVEGLDGRDQLIEKIGAAGVALDERAAFSNILSELYAEPPKTAEEIIADNDMSDLIVKVLRDIACAYNKSNPTPQLTDAILVETGKTNERYYDDMAKMNVEAPEMGGEPELEALSKALDIGLTILSVKSIGEDKDGTRRYNVQGNDKLNIALTYYSSHYNVARPRQPEVILEPALVQVAPAA